MFFDFKGDKIANFINTQLHDYNARKYRLK